MDMLNGPLGKKILAVALPLALTGILQQLFNAVDIAVIGQNVGANAMAAVGSNTALIALLINLFAGLSLGANVVISSYIGKGEEERVHRAVHTAVLIAVLGGLIMIVVGESLAAVILRLLGVPDEILGMALLYLRIYLLGMPVIILYNFEASIFRCIGDTKTPLICLSVSGLINVVLNLLFVLQLKMTVDGVALATVISNAVSAGVLFYLLTKSGSPVRVRRAELAIDKRSFKEILRIGVPSGLQMMMFSLSNVCVQSGINSLGAEAMAASAASNNVETFGYFALTSFGQACTTFVGQNNGAGKFKRCRQATRICLLQGLVAVVLIIAFILTFADILLGIFNSDAAVLSLGRIRLTFIVPAWIFSVIMEVLSGSMRGYGYSFIPAGISLVGTCVVRVLWINTIFRIRPTFPMLFTVYPVSLSMTGIATVAAYVLLNRKMQKNRVRLQTE